MKTRMFLFLLMTLILILPGCATHQELPSVSTLLPPNDEAAKLLLPSDTEEDAFDADEFQTFIETWKLSGLIHEDLAMTDENQDDVIKYFQKFDGFKRNYVMLLLQSIAAGEVTPANHYCDHEQGVYLRFCQFCLYDMNQDGFPELILKTGGCEADYWYTIYTVIDGELIDCGGFSGGHTELYANGLGRLVRYAGHMGVYNITLSTLEGTTLITQEITAGELDFIKGEDYPELAEYGYGDYDQCLEFSSIPTLILAPKG